MSHFDSRIAVVATLFAALSSVTAQAQWSTDPASSLVIADRSNEQVQPKIVATADGGFYISWFDNSTGGYDVYLQRVDAGGTEQWAHNGVLVADRSFSSTQDYGLDIDAQGNALLAFRYPDDNGIVQILAQKVAPDGTLLWGDPGVFASNDPDDAAAPKIAATGTGNVAVAWSRGDGAVNVHLMDTDGAGLWDSAFALPSGFFFLADLHGDADGNVIASWSAQLSFQDRELWAHKLAAADGSDLWGLDPVKVFDGSDGAMQLGYFPPFIPDGAGGAVFVWYTVGVSSGVVRVQHVDAAGTQLFAQNGALASIDATQSHVEPSGAYDPVSGDIYALWRETDIATQGQIGVYAQRLDSSGALQWGDGGKILVALAPLDQTQMRALPAPGGMFAAWSSHGLPDPMPIHVARLASDGSYVWPGEIVDISTEPNDTARLAGAISSDGYAAYAWTASAASFEGDIHAQNINLDGSLGAAVVDTIFADGFDPH